MKRLLILTFIFTLLSISVPLNAQEAIISGELDKTLLKEALIPNNSINEKNYNLLVKGNIPTIESFVNNNDGKFYYSIGDIASIKIKKSQLGELASLEGVSKIESHPTGLVKFNDSSRVNSRVDRIASGNLPNGLNYTGKDVLVGIIDEGIDITHPDFQNADGSTRIYAIWDMLVGAPTRNPDNFDYGQLWDSTEINDGSCTHTFNGTHGTASVGTIAGNGRSNSAYTGYAPEADIIFVNIDLSGSFGSKVADGVQWIFSVADSLGKPCVINTSIGSQKGAHDGRDLTTQTIENLLLAKSGRALVASAGNNGDDSIHLGYEVTADTSFTCFSTFPFFGNTAGWWECYVDTNDFKDVHFCVGVEKMNSSTYSQKGRSEWRNPVLNAERVNAGWLVDSIFDENNDYIGNYMSNLSTNEGRYDLKVYFRANITYFNDTADLYPSFHTTGSGKVTMWSNYTFVPSEWSQYITAPLSSDDNPAIANYKNPTNESTVVTSWQCSPYVLTVGNYRNRNSWVDSSGTTQTYDDIPVGQIANTSSHGPTRTGLTKPDIAAPGEFTMTPGMLTSPKSGDKIAPGGKHYIAGGTSIAGPAAAGVVALMLEANPNADVQTIIRDIKATAYRDEHTGDSVNNVYGYGKIDAFALLRRATAINYIATVDTACEGLPNTFTLNGSGADDNSKFYWDWDNDSTIDDSTNTLSIAHTYPDTGNYTASVQIINGDTVSSTYFFNARVNEGGADGISIGNDTSLCSGDNIQLMLIGSFESVSWNNGDEDNIALYTAPDTAIVSVVDSNNCTISDTLYIEAFGSPLDLGEDQSVCQGDTVTIDATIDGASYLWSDSTTNPTMEFTSTATLWLERSDSMQCIYRDTITLTVNENPTINFSDNEFCIGDSVTISIGHEEDSILWSNGAITSSITASIEDTFFVTVIDSNNCSKSSSVITIENALPNFDLGNDTIICASDSLGLGIAGVYNSIEWSNGKTGNLMYANTADTYSVIATDRNNCVGYDTITISVSVDNSFSLGNDTTLCIGESITLQPNKMYESYIWSNDSTDSSIVIQSAQTISLIVTDTINCSYSDEITISFQDTIEWNVEDTVSFCTGAEQIVTIEDNFINYVWNVEGDSNSITVNESGTYSVTATHISGCTSSDSFVVETGNLDYGLEFITSTSAPAKTIFANQTPDLAVYTFKWFFGDGDTSIAYHPIHDYTANGLYDITLVAYHKQNQCTDTLIKEDLINITQIPACDNGAVINFDSLTTKCIGDTFLLETIIDSTSTYLWFKNDLPLDEDSTFIVVRESGDYKVKVTKDGCAQISEEITINFSAAIDTPVIQLSGTPGGCERITLSTSTTYDNYKWSDGDEDPTTSIKTSGYFFVTVWNEGTCRLTSDSILLGTGEVADPTYCRIEKTGDSTIALYYDTNEVNEGIQKLYIMRRKLDDPFFRTIAIESTYDGVFFDNNLETHRVDSFYYILANKDTCNVRDTAWTQFRASYLGVDNLGFDWRVNWNNYEGIEGESYILYRATIAGEDTTEFAVVDTFDENTTEYIEVKDPDSTYMYKVFIYDTTQICGDTTLEYWTNTFITKYGIVTKVDERNMEEIKVYPNPFHNELNIESMLPQTGQLTISTLLGQTVYSENLELNRLERKTINLNPLQNGIYFIRIENDNYFKTIKVEKR